MSIVLSIIAIILYVVAHLVQSIVMLFTGVKNKRWYRLIDNRAFVLAYNTDVLGNYQYAFLWNIVFSKRGDNYKFGVFGETLSSCFGKKQTECSLSWFGWLALIIINSIDFSKWFKGGHCIASIQSEIEIRNFLTR